MAEDARERQLVDALQSDLHQLCNEARKKCPGVKLIAERALLRLRSVQSGKGESPRQAISRSSDILQTFLLGCEESKHPKIVQISVNSIQRLAENNALGADSIEAVLATLSNLVESGTEGVKVVQIIASLVSAADHVHGDVLAKSIVVCFRLQFSKDPMCAAVASATLRQTVQIVFERALAERETQQATGPSTEDALHLFKDLCLLTNGDPPQWFKGLMSMTRGFALELMETALGTAPTVFTGHPDFCRLLKENVCSVVIKLFSPSVKHGGKAAHPSFSVAIRLLRVMSVLISEFFPLLQTECEIFVSMLVKFAELDKPPWQRTMALEVIGNLMRKPSLLLSFCQSYDMEQHSTKIFRDLVNAVGGVVNSGLCNVTERDKVQVVMPAVLHSTLMLDLLDKTAATPVHDMYDLAVAFSAIVDCVKSMSSLVSTPDHALPSPHPGQSTGPDPAARGDDPQDRVLDVMLDSSWVGLHTALSLLLKYSSDQKATEAILRAMQSCIRIAGVLGHTQSRDSFVALLCAGSLPEKYSLTSDSPSRGWQVVDKHLVCVHSLLNTSLCLGALMGTAWLQILRTAQKLVSLLDLPHNVSDRAALMSTSSTAPRTTVRRTHSRTNSGSHIVSMVNITPSVASELPALGAMLSQLFEASRHLSDDALQALVNALCQLSEATLEQVTQTQSVTSAIFRHDAHLFPVGKILEVGHANLDRIMVYWPAVTAHLIEVCSHEHDGLREAGLEALTRLVHAALSHPRDPPIQDSPGLQQAILSPLRNLAACENRTAQQRQLECVHQVLDSCGQSLAHAWPVVIGIVSDALSSTPPPSETMLRTAFSSIQMVVADFLPTVPLPCLHLLLDALGGFGSQQEAVNISLTAIGLLWNTSDYISKHHERIQADAAAHVATAEDEADRNFYGLSSDVSTKNLWMALFSKLVDLCVDKRPEVRKSANQTLQSTVLTHGHLFDQETWASFLWTVLFALLDRYKASAKAAAAAPKAPPSAADAGMMMHHSRDTAEKQWAETSVIVLVAAARVFTTFHAALVQLPDFPRAWVLLLEHLQAATADELPEVSLAGVHALQEAFRAQADPAVVHAHRLEPVVDEMWRGAWTTWLQVARYSTTTPCSPKFLAAILQAFCLLHERLTSTPTGFRQADAVVALRFALDFVAVPHQDSLLATDMTDVQQQALNVTTAILGQARQRRATSKQQQQQQQQPPQQPVADGGSGPGSGVVSTQPTAMGGSTPGAGSSSSPDALLPATLKQLATFIAYGCAPPHTSNAPSPERPRFSVARPASFVAMSFHCMAEIVTVFPAVCEEESVVFAETAHALVTSLIEPLQRRHRCPTFEYWERAVQTLACVVDSGFRGIVAAHRREGGRTCSPKLANVAARLVDVAVMAVDKTLFSLEGAIPADIEKQDPVDARLVALVRDRLVKPCGVQPNPVSRDHLAAVYALLQRGSLGGVTQESDQDDPLVRSAFAQACFDVLLDPTVASAQQQQQQQQNQQQQQQGGQNAGQQQGAQDGASAGAGSDLSGVNVLIQGCRDVLEKYIADEQASETPLSTARSAEAATVIGKLSSLVSSGYSRLAVEIYPTLVACVRCSAPEIRQPLAQALLLYAQLLKAE